LRANPQVCSAVIFDDVVLQPSRVRGIEDERIAIGAVVSPVTSKGTTLGRNRSLLGFKIPHLGFSV